MQMLVLPGDASADCPCHRAERQWCESPQDSIPPPKVHVANMLQFEDRVVNRLLCFENIAHQDNATPLCPTCHSNFDDLNQTNLIFIPTNVEYFIEYEKNDQRRRRETSRIQRKGRSSYVTRYGVSSPDEYQNNWVGGLHSILSPEALPRSQDRKSTRLNSSHKTVSRMPSSA